MNRVICPNVLTPAHTRVLRIWGVAAPDPRPGLSPTDGSFVTVNAPDGWFVEPHAHGLYRVLRDERGFARALYFAKTARWYRRIEFDRLHRAIECPILRRYDLGDDMWQSLVTLGRRHVLWASDPTCWRELGAAAQTWRTERYPDHENYDAYWDLPIPDGAARFVEQA